MQTIPAGIRIGQMVMLDWIDSREATVGWQHFKDFKPQTSCRCFSVGWVVHISRMGPTEASSNSEAVAKQETISLAGHRADVDEKHFENNQISGVITIPTVAINKILSLPGHLFLDVQEHQEPIKFDNPITHAYAGDPDAFPDVRSTHGPSSFSLEDHDLRTDNSSRASKHEVKPDSLIENHDLGTDGQEGGAPDSEKLDPERFSKRKALGT